MSGAESWRWDRVIPWSFELILVSDQTFVDFAKNSEVSAEYTRRSEAQNSKFREVMDSIVDVIDNGGQLTPEMVFYHEHSIASVYGSLLKHMPSITMGEIAFMLSRDGYMMQNLSVIVREQFVELLTAIRSWCAPDTALAWLSLLFYWHQNNSGDGSILSTNFSAVAFDDAVPYVVAGIIDPAQVRSAIDNDIDVELVSNLV